MTFRVGLFFLGAVLFSSVCQAAGDQRDVVKAIVAVDARANSSSGGQSKDTGIDVAKRDVLIVNVDPNDDWSAGSDQPCTRKSNADGLTKCYGTYSMSNLSANYGSLVGRIGDGPFFLIGTSYENEATVSGRLRLYYWDSNSGDNSGFITANLVVNRRSGLKAVKARSLDLSFDVKVARQEGLLMGLRTILRALELRSLGNLSNMVAWQSLSGGEKILTLDSLRLVAVPETPKDFKGATVTWYQRRGSSGNWAILGTGEELIVRVPEATGALELYAETKKGTATHRSPPLGFKIEKSLCQGFYLQALALIADSVYFSRNFAKQGQTYAENWASKNTAPRSIKMKVDTSTGKPFEPGSGDVILRTAGPVSRTMGTLGSPGSPQTHSGILKVVVLSRGRKVHVVHQVVTNGYGSLPLTPGDAVLLAGGSSVGKGQPTFLADATIGSVEIWRPRAYVFVAKQGGFVLYQFMGTVAADRISETALKVKGYDFGFMESSILSREEPFSGLYYCNEFVREVYGIGQQSIVPPLAWAGAKLRGFNTDAGKPQHVPLLQRFWRGAFDCDREAAEARRQNTTLYGPGRLSGLLGDIDLDQVTFDQNDPKKDTETREAVAALIKTLRTYLDGVSIRQVLSDAVTGAVGRKTTNLKTQADKAAAVASNAAQRLGVPSEYGNLVFVGLQTTLRSWIAVGDRKIAEHLVDDMILDLSNALGTAELLQGGFTTVDGRTVFVTFEKISQ